MDKEKFFKEYLKWASENKENKKKGINTLSFIISILNSSNKNLTEEDFKKITGGSYNWSAMIYEEKRY